MPNDFWRANPLATALFFKLANLLQRRARPMRPLEVPVFDIVDFVNTGSSKNVAPIRQNVQYRVNLLKKAGYIDARRLACEKCLWVLPSQNYGGAQATCPHCSHKADPVLVLVLNKNAVTAMTGRFVEAGELAELVRDEPVEPVLHEIVYQPQIVPSGMVGQSPLLPAPELAQPVLPPDWKLDDLGWIVDEQGQLRPPWSPQDVIPRHMLHFIEGKPAIPASPADETPVPRMFRVGDQIAAQQAAQLQRIEAGVEQPEPQAFAPAWAMLSGGGQAGETSMRKDIESVRLAFHAAAQQSEPWRCLSEMLSSVAYEDITKGEIDPSIYGPQWLPEPMSVNESYTAPFAAVALAFGAEAGKLTQAPEHLRRAVVFSPYQNPSWWDNVLPAICQAEELFRSRVEPEVDARLSWVHSHVVGEDTTVLASAPMLGCAIEAASCLSEDDLMASCYNPVTQALMRECIQNDWVQLGSPRLMSAFFMCLVYGNTITIQEIGRWARGERLLFDPSNGRLAER